MHTCFYNVVTLKIYNYIFCFLVKKCLFLIRIYKVYIFNIHFQCCNIFENRCVYIYIYMLFAGWEVRMVKNCDRGLEFRAINTAISSIN